MWDRAPNMPRESALESLYVRDCRNLEYMIEKSAFTLASSTEPTTCTPNGFFPCLRSLELDELPKLKALRYSAEYDQQHVDTSTSGSSSMASIPLPQLEKLHFNNCQNLRCILLCPNLEDLELICFNKELQIINQSQKLGDLNFSTPSSSSYYVLKLRVVRVSDVAWLNSLPMEVLQCLVKMEIYGDSKIKNFGEAGLLFRSSLSSIKSLRIGSCSELTSLLRGGLEHLTTLDDLTIQFCDKLWLSGEEAEERVDDIGMPCPSLPHSLRKLSVSLPDLVHLPNWMQSLAALRTLEIHHCKGLESLPDWMPKLTSLRKLQLTACSGRLKERCQQFNGEDWPHIQHIPIIECYNEFDELDFCWCK